tara:strand:+ start:1287 stop:1481 length:195 start_codon:yes stop_codon:yes gene_type:complete
MRIEKINKVPYLRIMPKEHQKWCGLDSTCPKKEEKTIQISDGDLILYDKHGKINVHKGEKNGEY